MRDADLEIVETLTLLVVRTPLLIGWARRDERSMSEAELERAWHPATRDLAALLIGSLALFVHSLKARRNWRGFALGVAWVLIAELGTFALLSAEEAALQQLFPTPSAPIRAR